MVTETGLLREQNQRLNDEVKRRTHQMAAINVVAATVGYSLDLDVTFNTALRVVRTVVSAEAAGISLIEDDSGDVVLRAQAGWIHDFVQSNPMRVPSGKGMSGEVIRRDDAIVNNKLSDDAQYAAPVFGKEKFRSIVMAPMHARGVIIGILSVMSHRPDQFDDSSVDVLKSIADTVGVAIDNARLHEKHVESENRLRAILHSSADGIIATDRHNRISLVNPTAAHMLELNPDEVRGVLLGDAPIQPRLRDKLILALSPDADDSERTFRVSLESGLELSVIVSTVQVPGDYSGEASREGFVVVLQDVTHFREAEIARVQFIQAAAHDMKNPLSVTQSSIHTLEGMIDKDDPTLNEVIGIARTGILRLQRLIDDLLQIEKIESGYGFYVDDIDVREMCYEISAQIRPLMQERKLDYEVSISEDVPFTIHVDREWMQRALHNYLENAAKYNRPAGRVIFRVFVDHGALHFQVIDDGPGIPLRSQPRLFDRFYRVEERRDVRGSGLGLAIVKSVAEAHGGGVYVHSVEGYGSTFGITLPLEQERARVPAY
jgi:PAS domain S-box-containing protein